MFVWYLVGFVVIVAVIFAVGYIMKRKHYQRINALEAQKIELMERPVIDELTKVKKLRLTGQTEDLFESWRDSWDEIATKLFPDLEEYILGAEQHTDRYQFGKATQMENQVEQVIHDIDTQMKQILRGLKELIASEERNALDIRAAKDTFTTIRRDVLSNGYKLGDALHSIEGELDTVAENLNRFDMLTEQGDYLEARETVLNLQHDLEKLANKMDKIPSLLRESDIILPDEMSKLQAGYDEMANQGYYLEQLQLAAELERMSHRVSDLKGKIVAGELEAVENGVAELHTEINLFYDTLEHEVEARHFVKENRIVVEAKLEKQMAVSDALAEQIKEVKQTYHVADDELAVYLKVASQLQTQKEQLETVTERLSEVKIAYSAAEDTLKEIDAIVSGIALEQDTFAEELRSLRKDELEAREDAKRMRRAIMNLNQRLDRERLPGKPDEYITLCEHMEASISKLESKLEEKPLNMKAVNNEWRVAKEDLEHLTEKADEMIENVHLVEHVIQYANRYRLRTPDLAIALRKAEDHFYDDYQYKKALEIAVTALEKVEPNAFKKIEKAYEMKINVDEVE
ncbi:septation ring formation regulator EzrA [Listeria weihenstephanensis FSL R9-0317]|uniref:Septation ring formation regulator EzrA n=1 Tax=Listeria weihenstephanensis TaxID=1006155 RepID=A0A1S7FVF9_9LIST|nr:septation ring formation regulator EzrA [Listeria weihenstephanensis]AQY51347.1 septation ring formation regulator EzrA [Listeria weihenstephanensis]EUJ37146.1 septation ring formation regulator EzrA [Listeria weihenstephanensis FSL R9-0317]